MDTTWQAAVVLSALELTPGDPSDLTSLLRDGRQRQALLGFGVDHASQSESASSNSPLGQYLSATLDPGRVETWAKTLDRGAREGAYAAVIVGDPKYPQRLDRVWDAPPVLFRSCVPEAAPRQALVELDPAGKSLAIVGGREVTGDVLAATRAVAGMAAEQGVRVVSGLASGVDTAAHEGAVSANGLTTAVLGTGIDHVFPAENRGLAARIRHQGVLVSQFAPPAPRTGTTFLRRNAVIAALSDVSLIMDGRSRSGSRHEVEQAVRYGRPALMWEPALAREPWAQSFADAGCAAFVESVEEIAAYLG